MLWPGAKGQPCGQDRACGWQWCPRPVVVPMSFCYCSPSDNVCRGPTWGPALGVDWLAGEAS
eukprot:15450350-Alexandrium_andersonii.AAC.1